MVKKKTDPGKTGKTVASNIERLRTDDSLSYAELSRRLDELGNPIPPLGLRRIEESERKVDVDDLVALAVALATTPSYLLMPHYTPENLEVAGTGTQKMGIKDYWRWLTSQFEPSHRFPGDGQLTPQQMFDRLALSRPAFDIGSYIKWNVEGATDGND